MRISDWSSDVCSSDLSASAGAALAWRRRARKARRFSFSISAEGVTTRVSRVAKVRPKATAVESCRHHWVEGAPTVMVREKKRSEEHTSELQSLMRISYAVFCLKKNTQTQNTQYDTHHIL